MRKKIQIIILLFLLFLVSTAANFNYVLAQDRELEVEYPEVEGLKPEKITFPITKYVKYIFNYLIALAGLIALGGLIYGGVIYLTSSGSAEKLKKAQKQILVTFLGIIILFSSYLILRTINPELVKFDLPRLKQIIFSPLQAPPSQVLTPELLTKVRKMAEKIKDEVIPDIETSSQKIQELTNDNHCKCENTQSMCVCSGGDAGASCQPLRCYAGPGFQPCPDEKEIKENQKSIIAWRDEILYYRNRAIEEEKDLQDEIKKVLDEKIVYYQRNIIIEEDDKVKQYFTEEKQKVTEEKNLKKSLSEKLKELADLIEKISKPSLEIGALPDRCLIDVKDKCTASCKGQCHDYIDGCQPDKCSGGNPCPTGEIQSNLDEIQSLKPKIIQASNEIIRIIDEIIKLKIITIWQ